MNLKKTLKDYTVSHLFVFLSLCLFGMVFLFPSIARAYPATSALSGGHPSMSQYCKMFQLYNNQKLCRDAWEYGYNSNKGPTYSSSSSAADNKCNSLKGGKYSPINAPKRLEACKKGFLQKGSENPSGGGGSDSGGGGSSGGGGGSESAPGNAGDLGGDNKTEGDGDTEDGITVDGKDISASAIKLDSGDTPKNISKTTPEQFVTGLLNIVYSLAASIAVIVIVAAGVMYVVSDGDPARTTRAKNAIIYAAVGLVITGSAFVITGIIQGIGAN